MLWAFAKQQIKEHIINSQTSPIVHSIPPTSLPWSGYNDKNLNMAAGVTTNFGPDLLQAKLEQISYKNLEIQVRESSRIFRSVGCKGPNLEGLPGIATTF